MKNRKTKGEGDEQAALGRWGAGTTGVGRPNERTPFRQGIVPEEIHGAGYKKNERKRPRNETALRWLTTSRLC